MTEDEQSVEMIRLEYAKGHALRWSPGDVGILLGLLDKRVAEVDKLKATQAPVALHREMQEAYLRGRASTLVGGLDALLAAEKAASKAARAAALEEAANWHQEQRNVCHRRADAGQGNSVILGAHASAHDDSAAHFSSLMESDNQH